MNPPFVLTPAAARDIEDICEHLAQESIPAAYRIATAIEAALARLAKRPATGHLREDLADRRHRFFVVYS